MIEISKELLLRIIPLDRNEVFADNYHTNINNSLHIGYVYNIVYNDKYVGSGAKHFNIHELAHKCKEWALSQKCFINLVYNEFWWYKIEKKYIADIPNKNKCFYEDTEVEAIIKACEWILDNKIGSSE